MIQVVVTGIGLISSLGNNLEESWQHLIAGKSGIKLYRPFPELQPLPLGLIGDRPTELKNLTRQVVISALQDASLVPPLPDCGIVIGSSRSYQAEWEKMARWMYEEDNKDKLSPPSTSSPPSLLSNLPHMNAIAAAQLVGATGIVLAPMAACATGIWALFQAFNLIKSGRCERVVAGAVEAAITPLTITGFSQMGALAKTGAYPFDIHREGLVLGEGGAVFVLESAKLARQRRAKVYGEIYGFGLTADAYHTNQLDPQGKGAISAVKECLHRTHISPEDIDYIHAHGTATQMNDSVESKVIQSIFSQQVAVSSTKGSTGHTIGASGALGVAFSLMSLNNQILPPSVGLKEPEFDLNLVTEARESVINKAMCFSFGFGGQNAVVVLGNGSEAKKS
ncbi:3-oxoacyl-(acyl-carrier-protein) synthase [Rivularia sp. PCC 7116]|uniref:beta-ketoacyl-ACP synthase n=1 Tax=Rivularia sp. PCC 7116 TaxID=373994 RepID=UPI00029F02A9|nr:beta-ketoacyl-ACP synthase [Rivularia sp. PCC 7116]AFY55018.1 3-oxoacyl-(acyl-carrier-protein) synthase [Rivularia sp. PCC 7116]